MSSRSRETVDEPRSGTEAASVLTWHERSGHQPPVGLSNFLSFYWFTELGSMGTTASRNPKAISLESWKIVPSLGH